MKTPSSLKESDITPEVLQDLSGVGRICAKCGSRPSRLKKGGTWCRHCYNAWKRARYQKFRIQEVERSKIYNKAHPEKVAANMRKCRERNPEHFKEYQRNHVANNREKYNFRWAAKHHRRRVIIKSCPNSLNFYEWQEIKKSQEYRCFYCKTPTKKLTVDHVVPLAKGGSPEKSNIVAACLSCNCSKQALSVDEFLKKKGLS